MRTMRNPTNLSLGGTDGNGNDFFGFVSFLEFHGFFESDLIEWVHRMLDIVGLHTFLIWSNTNLDCIVDHSFDTNKDTHD